ncbi:putative histone acetyltransferase chromatin regulator PHD family [Helianthus annuus]|uniref:Histone acetyltransferase chromatin regulator PHD family n=1 Tax=Helianthus annuus TaxID=4232 RepID=A0A9K3I9N2_HELAN|nr:putative histone acetyltransferase chromatin regulator PHD family [Helianthus annuus]KAJ0527120.1 putative histone acetyltransferase chromatin regulator PHD family [Helianthus annuus]KAJ0543522.1 putative histone acetyltransferase chromatin regulator PHD family [Helianthus annuus]KAJ0708574.1 putative histone acetyltransferase chromatin regulator DDT family [Helianthus annuus]
MRASDIKIIMKKCRSKGDYFKHLGNNLKFDEIKDFEFASRHPLDIPTVDINGTYGGSLEAFLEDFRKLWINLGKTHVKTPNLVILADERPKTSKCNMKMRFIKSSYCDHIIIFVRFLHGGAHPYKQNRKQVGTNSLSRKSDRFSEVDCKLTALTKSSKNQNMEIIKESVFDTQSFPQGALLSSTLSSHAVGTLLEVHDFLCCFKEVIGLDEQITFEKLEQELLRPYPYGVGKSSILCSFETFIHSKLLPELVSKLLDRLASVLNSKLGVKTEFNMLPINELTWPEVVRRYIMAYLLTGDRLGSVKITDGNMIELIHCLQSDCSVFCSSPTNVAGVDLDAQLLGKAVNNVFGKLRSVRSTLSMGVKGEDSDGSIPQWAKVLDPVHKLATNVGSRIRNCVYEALNQNPPEWARMQLEASIAKGFYKGNACGPTKRAILEVLKRATSDVPQRPLSLDVNATRSSCELLMSKVIMTKCRSILRNVAATYDNEMDFSILVRSSLKSDEIKVVFESASRRPLDLPMIDLRLLHDTYCGSPQAFLEDVSELWINLKKSHMNTPRLVKLVDDMSTDFTLKYENEVSPLLSKLSGYSMNGELNAEVEKELEELLASIEIPAMSLEAGVCKVCGVNQDDDKVLLCDTEWCNAEYHMYCLNPALSEIPQGTWYCPACKQLADDQPKGIRISQSVDKSFFEEASLFLDIVTALEETEYWQLEAQKKIFLLKFLVDRSLETSLIRMNLAELQTKLAKKFLGVDSVGRIYWGFPYVSTNSGIVINGAMNTEIDPFDHRTSHSEYNNFGQWYLFQSDEEISKLVGYLSVTDPCNTELRDSILLWQNTMLQNGQHTGGSKSMGGETVCSTSLNNLPSRNCLATNATMLIEAQYGSCKESDATNSAKKSRGKNMVKWHRCNCLEPVFPSRYHCVNCHETFFTSVEFEHHKNSTCEIKCEVGSSFTVPESSSKPLLGNTHILRRLMMNLLDIEAALPDGARRSSMESPKWRSAWCAFVKSATTICEIVEATLALETMIKTEYINNTWWWYWSSISGAAKTSTTAALALRVHTLDAAIRYLKNA